MNLNDIMRRSGLAESLNIKLKEPKKKASDIYRNTVRAKVYTIGRENAILKDTINSIVDHQRVARGESIDFDAIKSKLKGLGDKIKGAFSIKLNKEESEGNKVVYTTVKSFKYAFNKDSAGSICIEASPETDPKEVIAKIKEFNKVLKSAAAQINQTAKELGATGCDKIHLDEGKDVAEITFSTENGKKVVKVTKEGDISVNGQAQAESYRAYREKFLGLGASGTMKVVGAKRPQVRRIFAKEKRPLNSQEGGVDHFEGADIFYKKVKGEDVAYKAVVTSGEMQDFSKHDSIIIGMDKPAFEKKMMKAKFLRRQMLDKGEVWEEKSLYGTQVLTVYFEDNRVSKLVLELDLDALAARKQEMQEEYDADLDRAAKRADIAAKRSGTAANIAYILRD